MTTPPRHAVPAPTVLLGIVCTLVLLQLLIVGKGDIPALIWLLAPIYAVYVTAILLVCAAVVAHLRGRPRLPVPLLPERWRAHRTTYLALTTLVVFFTLLREGGFAPELVASYDVFQAEHRTDTSRNSSFNSATQGDGPPDVMAARPVHCMLDCANRGPTCTAVLEGIRCDDQGDVNANPEGAVLVQGTISLDDPACYFPLYKSSDTRFSAELSVNLATGHTTKSLGLSLQGTLTQDAIGPMSCYSYRRLVAQKITAELAGALQSALNEN